MPARAGTGIRIYGLASCDACRAARKWAAAQGLDSDFVDLRVDPVPRAKLEEWLAALGPERLVNRRSTTWRGLSGAEREQAGDARRAAALLAKHPTLVKRPVIEADGAVSVGFDAATQARLAAEQT